LYIVDEYYLSISNNLWLEKSYLEKSQKSVKDTGSREGRR
jgi:hypothetical protein